MSIAARPVDEIDAAFDAAMSGGDEIDAAFDAALSLPAQASVLPLDINIDQYTNHARMVQAMAQPATGTAIPSYSQNPNNPLSRPVPGGVVGQFATGAASELMGLPATGARAAQAGVQFLANRAPQDSPWGSLLADAASGMGRYAGSLEGMTGLAKAGVGLPQETGGTSETLGHGAAQLGMAVIPGAGPTSTLGRAGVFAATSAAPVIGQTMRDAVTETGNAPKAADEAITAGAITGITSFLPGAAILQRVPGGSKFMGIAAKRAITRLAGAGIAEGSQEYMEGVGDELATEMIRHDKRLTYKMALDALTNPQRMMDVLGGAVLGTVAHAPFEAAGHHGVIPNAFPDAQPAEAQRSSAVPPARDAAPALAVEPRAPVGDGAAAEVGAQGQAAADVPAPVDPLGPDATDADVQAWLDARAGEETDRGVDAAQSQPPLDAQSFPDADTQGNAPSRQPARSDVSNSGALIPSASFPQDTSGTLLEVPQASGLTPLSSEALPRSGNSENSSSAPDITPAPTTAQEWRAEARRLGVSERGTLRVVRERVEQARLASPVREQIETPPPAGPATNTPNVAGRPSDLSSAPVSESSASPTVVPTPPAGREGAVVKPSAFRELVKTARADVHELAAQQGWELTDDNRVIFRDTRSSTGQMRITSKDFVDWVMGKTPNDDPMGYSKDPEWTSLVERTRETLLKASSPALAARVSGDVRAQSESSPLAESKSPSPVSEKSASSRTTRTRKAKAETAPTAGESSPQAVRRSGDTSRESEQQSPRTPDRSGRIASVNPTPRPASPGVERGSTSANATPDVAAPKNATPRVARSSPRRRGAAINPIDETLDIIKRTGVRAAAKRTRDLAKIEQRGADDGKTEAEKLTKQRDSAEVTVKAYKQQIEDARKRSASIKGIEERGATVANRRLLRTELELEEARMAADDMRAKLRQTVAENRSAKDLREVMQAKVTEMAKDYLPPDIQGKLLVQVRDAKNAGDVFRSLFKIEGLLLDRAQRNTVRLFQASSAKSMLGKLTEERRTQAKDIIATAMADVEALKAPGATADARRAAMDSLLDKTNQLQQIHHEHKIENKLRVKGEWVDRQATLRRLSAAIALDNTKPRGRDAKDPTKLNESLGIKAAALARHALTPESLFMRIDGDFKTGDVATDTAYWAVNKAQESYDADARNYMAALDGLARSLGFDGYADVAARTSGTLGDATQQRAKVRIPNGDPVAEGEHTTLQKGGADTLSVGQIADLYLASMDHETAALMRKGQQWKYEGAPDAFDVAPSDVSALAEGVDRRVLDFYEKANAMLNTHAPEMMHQQWLVKGYESPIPTNHWTRHRDRSALPVQDNTGPMQEANTYLENWGGLKARKQNTSVPLIIGDVHRNLMDKMDMTFRIKHLMVPLWTARRVMQDKSILDAIESRYGKQANKDIDNYFKRNGGLDGRDDSMLDRIAAKYSGAVTKLNPKSWAKQPASYATMLIDVSPAEWAKGVGSMFSPTVHREMIANSDMAANRAGADPASLYAGLNAAKPGRSSGRLAAMAGIRSIRAAASDAMKADLRGVAGNVDDAMSKATPAAADRISAANWMDGAPLRALWSIVKERHGGQMSPAMVEEFERIGSRHMNSGRETQQSFLASGMKAKGTGVFTAFTTDLQKMRSNLYRAAHMDNKAKAKAVAGIAMSIAYTSAINYGWKTATNAAAGAFSKKDDESEDRALYDSLLDGVAGLVPTGNAITGFARAGMRGWKDPLFNAPVYSGIEETARSAVTLGSRIFKRLNGNTKATDKALGDLYDLLSDYAKLRGVPMTPVDTVERAIEKRMSK